jgi:hypothetical protein
MHARTCAKATAALSTPTELEAGCAPTIKLPVSTTWITITALTDQDRHKLSTHIDGYRMNAGVIAIAV